MGKNAWQIGLVAAASSLCGGLIVFVLMSWRETSGVAIRFRTVGLIAIAVWLFVLLLLLIILRQTATNSGNAERRNEFRDRMIVQAVKDAALVTGSELRELKQSIHELSLRRDAAGLDLRPLPGDLPVKEMMRNASGPSARSGTIPQPSAAAPIFAGPLETFNHWWQKNGQKVNAILLDNRMGVAIVDSLEAIFAEKGIDCRKIEPLKDANVFSVELAGEPFQDHFILVPILRFPLKKYREFFQGEVNDPKYIERPALARIVRESGGELIEPVENGKGVLQ